MEALSDCSVGVPCVDMPICMDLLRYMNVDLPRIYHYHASALCITSVATRLFVDYHSKI